MGEFTDSPLMTRGAHLNYSCTWVGQNYISSIPSSHVLRHDGGTVLLDDAGMLHGARCSSTLDPVVTSELLKVHWEMERRLGFLQRGKEVSNVCGSFNVFGKKCDLNTKLSMTHTPGKEGASAEVQARLKLRRLFLRYVYPIVRSEFGWLFGDVVDWVGGSGAQLYAGFVTWFVTGVTSGRVFWPRSHVDPDLWYTVLVCVDYGRGVVAGGDFGFASNGWVLQCKHGDVLVYNGLCLHGTTEFSLPCWRSAVW